MRFKHPDWGDTRVRIRFAWLPTRIDGYTVWLEYYKEKSIYMLSYGERFWKVISREPHEIW